MFKKFFGKVKGLACAAWRNGKRTICALGAATAVATYKGSVALAQGTVDADIQGVIDTSSATVTALKAVAIAIVAFLIGIKLVRKFVK